MLTPRAAHSPPRSPRCPGLSGVGSDQPRAGICSNTFLRTCCGRSQPRLPALPHQPEEEEEEKAAAGWDSSGRSGSGTRRRSRGGRAGLCPRQVLVGWAGAAQQGVSAARLWLWQRNPTPVPSGANLRHRSGVLVPTLGHAVPPSSAGAGWWDRVRVAPGTGSGARVPDRAVGTGLRLFPELVGTMAVVPLPAGLWSSRQGPSTALLPVLLPGAARLSPRPGRAVLLGKLRHGASRGLAELRCLPPAATRCRAAVTDRGCAPQKLTGGLLSSWMRGAGAPAAVGVCG